MTAMGKNKKVIGTDKQGLKKNQSVHVKKEFKPTDKRGRIVVRNLPFKCNEDDVKKHFQSFGQIKEVKLLRRKDNSLIGVGFVEYKSRQNAVKAIETLNGKPFLGRPIYVEKAIARDSYDETDKKRRVDNGKDKSFSGEDGTSDEDDEKREMGDDVKEEQSSSDERMLDESEIKQEDAYSSDEMKPSFSKKETFKQKLVNENTKNEKSSKKARLIVRNLSFKVLLYDKPTTEYYEEFDTEPGTVKICRVYPLKKGEKENGPIPVINNICLEHLTTEETMRAHFSRFGEIVEVTLLRKPDNSLVGCGFVEFDRKQAAAKAIYHTSGKPLLGRPIIVDWALPKDTFKKAQSVKKEIKIEELSDEDMNVEGVKDEKIAVKDEVSDNESEEDSEQSEEEDSDEDEDEDESDAEEEDESEVKKEVKQRRKSDIDEGLTVFVKNLPFTVDNEDFKDCMKQFGPVFYALVCKDKFTEHSRGSGFVKFKKKEDAEKCLSAGTELTLKGNILDPHPALKKSDIEKKKDNKNETKDNRNLYLVKEGMIYAGTPAAQGVSASDMEQRLQLEQKKTNKLKNLNNVVSRDRLIVHNLPPAYTDQKLRKLFKSVSQGKAVLKEAKVMRILNQLNDRGFGMSKGYGFVTFSKHEDALNALRKINNNPDIFTSSKRPIVAFSIESLTVLNAKWKRLERSRQRNPLCKDYKPEGPPAKKSKVAEMGENKPKAENGTEPEFAGEVARPGQKVRMRKRHKLKEQAQQHSEDVRREKREMKAGRNARRAQHLKLKQVEKKTKKKKKTSKSDDFAFDNLVNKYKTKLQSEKGGKKWYDS